MPKNSQISYIMSKTATLILFLIWAKCMQMYDNYKHVNNLLRYFVELKITSKHEWINYFILSVVPHNESYSLKIGTSR